MTANTALATSNPRTWVMGNWKLNPSSLSKAEKLANELASAYSTANIPSTVNVAVAPTLVHLTGVQTAFSNAAFTLMAQDISKQNTATGAYTGDVSASLLKDIGVNAVLVGHSERREYQKESNEVLTQKITAALAEDLQVVFCVGESLATREAGEQNAVIQTQIETVIKPILADVNAENLIIAYEPIWAIGTGKVAEVADIQAMHAFIRNTISSLKEELTHTSILYGGSVKPENAGDIAQCKDVNGALVGGASLKAQSFLDIVRAFG